MAEGLTRVAALPAEGPLGAFPPTDGGDYYSAGVPIVNFISSPVYLLNSDDTPEKVARERLVPTARTVVHILPVIAPVHIDRPLLPTTAEPGGCDSRSFAGRIVAGVGHWCNESLVGHGPVMPVRWSRVVVAPILSCRRDPIVGAANPDTVGASSRPEFH